MTSISLGTPIRDVRGRTLGAVRAVNNCCIQSTDGASIRRDAILDVQQFAIELICDGDQLSRYSCGMHEGAAEKRVGGAA